MMCVCEQDVGILVAQRLCFGLSVTDAMLGYITTVPLRAILAHVGMFVTLVPFHLRIFCGTNSVFLNTPFNYTCIARLVQWQVVSVLFEDADPQRHFLSQ